MNYLEVLYIEKDISEIKNKLIKIEDLENDIVNFNRREFYILDGKYSFDISSLVIKKNCILLKLDFIRSIIFKDKIYIVELKSSEFLEIKKKLGQNILNNRNINSKFHINFIDFLFSEMSIYFDNLIHDIAPKISSNNEQIKLGNYIYNDFRVLQTSLLHLEYRIKEIKTLINELLVGKEDIIELGLDEKNIDETLIEEMIENYNLKFQDLDNDVTKLTREIENVQNLFNIDLAKKRNIYAIFNIYISIASLSLSFGSYIGSMFGMNLRNKFEDSNVAFIVTFLSSLFLVLITLIIQIKYFRDLANI